MTNYHERLDKVNEQDREVLSCIDRPIREMVVQLNRIGLKTKFSCCGFSYDGEEEPKSHAPHPFVVLHDPLLCQGKDSSLQNHAIISFFRLGRAVASIPLWILKPYTGNGEWYLYSEQAKKIPDEFWDQEKGTPSIHNYETPLIAIMSLTKLLQKIPNIAQKFTIKDGNSMYEDTTSGEWQVKPKRDSIITMVKDSE